MDTSLCLCEAVLNERGVSPFSRPVLSTGQPWHHATIRVLRFSPPHKLPRTKALLRGEAGFNLLPDSQVVDTAVLSS